MTDNKPIKNIEVGKFYLIHDGSDTGHPGLIIEKDDLNNRYLVILTESDKKGNMSKREADKRHLTDLTHPTDSTVIKSYVKNRPMLCKRRDIGTKELIDMQINEADMNIINIIKQRSPKYSPSFKRNKKSNR